MGWKVVYSLRSQRDLQRVVETIARDDPGAAEKFGLALIEQAEFIARAPEMGVMMIRADFRGRGFFRLANTSLFTGPKLIGASCGFSVFGMVREAGGRSVERA